MDRYDYRDADGDLRYQVVRTAQKEFRQRRPDGAGGWIWDLGDVDRLLYRLPELLSSRPRVVFIVEGEKDVETLRRMRLIATCNSGGAGNWVDRHANLLAGRRVVVVPDNDATGRKHAGLVASSTAGLAAEVRIVQVPGAEGSDVTDWIEGGGTLAQLYYLYQAALRWTTVASPAKRKVAIEPSRLSDPSLVRRAIKYLERIPGAVSGQGGHSATFRVACLLVRDFALPLSEAAELLADWNTRCEPPWSERELEHKLKSAQTHGQHLRRSIDVLAGER